MSDKTVAQKLLIRKNYKVLFVNEPENYASILGELPPDVMVLHEPAEPADSADLIQLFVTSQGELEAQLGKMKSALKPGGLLWVTYPKGTSKAKADINRDSIRGVRQDCGTGRGRHGCR